MTQDSEPEEEGWRQSGKQQRAARRRRATDHLSTEQLLSLARERGANDYPSSLTQKGKGKGKSRPTSEAEQSRASEPDGSDDPAVAASSVHGRKRWNLFGKAGTAPWQSPGRTPNSAAPLWYDRDLEELIAFNEGENLRQEKRLEKDDQQAPIAWWCENCSKGHRKHTVRFCVACNTRNPDPVISAGPPNTGQRSVSIRQVDFTLPSDPTDTYLKATNLLDAVFTHPANKNFKAAFAPAITPVLSVQKDTQVLPITDATAVEPNLAEHGGEPTATSAAPSVDSRQAPPDTATEPAPPAANKEALAALQFQLDSHSALAPEHRNSLILRTLKKQTAALKKPIEDEAFMIPIACSVMRKLMDNEIKAA